MPALNTGRRRIVAESAIQQIRARWAANKGPAWGYQKVIAGELNLSQSCVNQVIRGHRRKAA